MVTRSGVRALNRTALNMGFPCGSAGKESACSAGHLGSIPWLGRSPGVEGKGYPLLYSGREKGCKDSDTTERLSFQTMKPKKEHDGKCTSEGLSQLVLLVKNPRARAGDIRDSGLILGSGRFFWRRTIVYAVAKRRDWACVHVNI